MKNRNGKLFIEFLERNPSLIVVNALDVCEGLITRKREVRLNAGTKTEEAVLDFFVVNDLMLNFIKKMLIDEGREFCLSNLAQIRQNKRIIESDHNPLILDLDIQFSKRKPERVEMFNLRNTVCQEAFKQETENNAALLEVFETELPFEIQSKKWFKEFNNILHKCFRKVRIVNNKKKENCEANSLLTERVELQKKVKAVIIDDDIKKQIEHRIAQIEEEIEKEVTEESVQEIVDALKELGGDKQSLGGNGRRQMWKLLKKYSPKSTPSVPVGKKDSSGNLITNHEGLKKLYLKTYVHRLRNRTIKEDFADLKELKNKLFEMRLELSGVCKTETWEMKDLDRVLNALKKDKARDPNGWANVIFKDGVAGKDLKISLLTFLNKIKSENFIPEFVRKTDVTTIYLKERNLILKMIVEYF